jgi:phosphatidate cytidylyltransferase
MAFNVQTFKTRAFTSVVFVIVMLTGLLINYTSFFLLFTIIHFGCWIEYQKLVGLIDEDYQKITAFHKYGVMVLGWSFMLWMTNGFLTLGNFRFAEIGWWLMIILVIVLPIAEISLSQDFNFKNIAYSLFGLAYISLSWGLMINLRSTFANSFLGDIGWILPVVLIASIWINDTMAYIVGSFIGKTPLTSISPKKTWEGTLGGAAIAIAVVSLVCHYAFGFDLIPVIIISSIAAIIGTMGDILESKLKRMAGVKDSGSIMPGHGGFLDRFDSLLLATPFVWLYVVSFL